MTAWQVYWWLKLDMVGSIVIGMGVLGVAATLITFVCTMVAGEYDECALAKKWKLRFIVCMVMSIAVIITGNMLPTSKEAAVIYMLPRVVNSDVVKKDVPELYEAAKGYLLEMLQPRVVGKKVKSE